MLNESDKALLKRAIHNNKCVLFLGAGFSADATNCLGGQLPAGRDLGAALWGWLGYEKDHGSYDPGASPLDKLFDVARKKKGDRQVREFLTKRLSVVDYKDWYAKIAYPYWYRIYTTNVDDLIERIFAQAATTRLDVINAITTRYRSRSDILDNLQYIKLNGTLADDVTNITFGARQFAKRSGEYDPWYDHFVRDYSQRAERHEQNRRRRMAG